MVLTAAAVIFYLCSRSKKMCTCIPMLKNLHKKERKRLFSRAYWWTGLVAILFMIITAAMPINCDPPTLDCHNVAWTIETGSSMSETIYRDF